MTRFGLLLAAGLLTVTSCSGSDLDAGTPTLANPSATETATTSPPPLTIGDLRRGAMTDHAFAVGKTLVIGSRRVRLRSKPFDLVDSIHSVIVRFGDGSIINVYKRSMRIEHLTATSASKPIADPYGNFAAWQEDGPDPAAVTVYYGGLGGSRFIDRQSFPTDPEWCDNPFQVLGMTGSDLYVSVAAGNRTWVWNIYEGQEGVPHEVPNSDHYVREVHGLHGGYVLQVTKKGIVVGLPSTKDGPTRFGIGDASDGTYRETDLVEAEGIEVTGEWVVSWSEDDAAIVNRLGNRNQLANSEPVALQLPTPTDRPEVYWEDDHQLLLDLTDTSGKRALLRCDPRSGTCEVARMLKHSALVAG